MIRVTTVLNRDNVNKVRFIVNGEPSYLDTITKIELWIPELNLTISNDISTDYPLKWEFTPADVGLLEMQLGLESTLIDKYVISTTGDIATGSEIISNIPDSVLALLETRMLVYGTGLGNSAQIVSVKRSTGEVYLNTASIADTTGLALKFYRELDNNIHLGKLFIYSPLYPEGLFWTDLEIKVDIGV